MEMQEESPSAPKISALIVSHNCAASLRRCLASLEQSAGRERMEILVVDNGSRDECPRLDAEFPDITILRLPRNFGLTKALNIGTRTAKGDYLFLLEPGIEVRPETAACLSAHLDSNAQAAAACPLMLDASGQPVTQIYPLPDRESLAAVCRGREMPGGIAVQPGTEPVEAKYPGKGALMVRRQFVRGMNYFDERFGQFWADAELAYQIRRASRSIMVLPDVTVLRNMDPEAAPGLDGALLDTDCTVGAAAYLAKHEGSMAGLKFRISAILHSLVSIFGFRNTGYHLSMLMGLLSGQKIDGSQSG